MTDNRVASDTANNSMMIMQLLRAYLSRFGLMNFIPQVEKMLSYDCWCQILKERFIYNESYYIQYAAYDMLIDQNMIQSNIPTILGKTSWKRIANR